MFIGGMLTPCWDVSGSGRGSGGRGSSRGGGASAGVEFESGGRSSVAFGFLGHGDENVLLSCGIRFSCVLNNRDGDDER